MSTTVKWRDAALWGALLGGPEPAVAADAATDEGALPAAGRDAWHGLLRDWAHAARLWAQEDSTHRFVAAREEEAAREAAWETARRERERAGRKARALDAALEQWAAQKQSEAAAEAAATAAVTTTTTATTTSGEGREGGARGGHLAGRPKGTPPAASDAPQRQGEDAAREFFSLHDIDTVPRQEIPLNMTGAFAAAEERLRVGAFREALRLLDDVVAHCLALNRDSAALRGYRAAVRMRAGAIEGCLEDSLRAMELDDAHVPSFARAARCYLLLDRAPEARNLLSAMQVRCMPYNAAAELVVVDQVCEFKRLAAAGQHGAALVAISAACSAVPEPQLEVRRLEALGRLRPEEALSEAVALSDVFPADPEVLYWRALLQYRSATDALSFGALQQLLARCLAAAGARGHPRGKQLQQLVRQIEARRSVADSLAATRRWRQAVQEYTNLLMLPLDNERLVVHFLHSRADASLKLGNHSSCAIDCSTALGKQLPCHRAALFSLRCEAFAALGRLDDAICDAQEELRCAPSIETEEKIRALRRERTVRQQQQRQQQPSGAQGRPASAAPSSRLLQQPTHYDTLAVPTTADRLAITKAYKRAALRWHPDKWARGTEQQRRAAEDHFKALNHAYSVLSQESLRKQYDATLPSS